MNIEKYKFRNSKQPCNVLLHYIKRNENPNHFMTIFFSATKGTILLCSIATVTFSSVKISCFWAKVVYNNNDYLMLKVNFVLQTSTKQGKKCTKILHWRLKHWIRKLLNVYLFHFNLHWLMARWFKTLTRKKMFWCYHQMNKSLWYNFAQTLYNSYNGI